MIRVLRNERKIFIFKHNSDGAEVVEREWLRHEQILTELCLLGRVVSGHASGWDLKTGAVAAPEFRTTVRPLSTKSLLAVNSLPGRA
jgi:hypothetical protein